MNVFSTCLVLSKSGHPFSYFSVGIGFCDVSGMYGEDLTVHQGKVHDYLGMDLDYSTPGEVRVLMIKYMSRILEEFP